MTIWQGLLVFIVYIVAEIIVGFIRRAITLSSVPRALKLVQDELDRLNADRLASDPAHCGAMTLTIISSRPGAKHPTSTQWREGQP